MTPQTIRQMIEAGLPDSSVIVQSDDNTHFEAIIISKLFSPEEYESISDFESS